MLQVRRGWKGEFEGWGGGCKVSEGGGGLRLLYLYGPRASIVI